MKKFLKKRFIGIPIAVIAVFLLVATVALAVLVTWEPAVVPGEGEIVITEATAPGAFTTTPTLVFSPLSFVEGTEITTTATVTVTNTCSYPIASLDVAFSAGATGLTAGTPVVDGTFPLQLNDEATITYTLTGTAPGPGTIDLTSVSTTITPVNP